MQRWGRNGLLMTEIIEQFPITSYGVERCFLSLTPKGILIPTSSAAVILSSIIPGSEILAAL